MTLSIIYDFLLSEIYKVFLPVPRVLCITTEATTWDTANIQELTCGMLEDATAPDLATNGSLKETTAW